MPGKRSLTNLHLDSLCSKYSFEHLEERLSPKETAAPVRAIRPSTRATVARAEEIYGQAMDNEQLPVPEEILDEWSRTHLADFSNNIENCIGTVKLPVGVAGPLRIHGLYAQGDFPVPLATTEAALVACYHRGISLISAAGGCTAMLLYEAVNRAPAFAFESMRGAGRFVAWAMENFEQFQAVTGTTTSHGKLLDMGVQLEGNHVYLNLEYCTGDASGQNMVTLATQAICDYIEEKTPVRPVASYVEGNLSGDKKASAQAYTSVRGKKVTAEAVIPAELVQKFLHASPAQLVDYWRMSAIGGVLSGTMGIHGHFANGLAAIYIATGQDAACVAESAIGVTRFELREDNSLYAAVTLPGIMVGTVGGGTNLPSQREFLQLMGLGGPGKSQALAEVVAGALLGGELSIIGALAAGEFTRAHRKLARLRQLQGDHAGCHEEDV